MKIFSCTLRYRVSSGLAKQYQHVYSMAGRSTWLAPSSPSTPSAILGVLLPSIIVMDEDSRLSFAFFSACSEIRVNSVTNDWPQKALESRQCMCNKQSRMTTYLVYFCTYLSSFSKFTRRCSSPMVTASCIAPASSSVFHGLTIKLPLRLCAAPVNSERIITPCRFFWLAIYSYDTRFMPSRVEETRQTSETAYNAMSSSKLTDLCMKWMGMNSMVPDELAFAGSKGVCTYQICR